MRLWRNDGAWWRVFCRPDRPKKATLPKSTNELTHYLFRPQNVQRYFYFKAWLIIQNEFDSSFNLIRSKILFNFYLYARKNDIKIKLILANWINNFNFTLLYLKSLKGFIVVIGFVRTCLIGIICI